jgi:glycosyltransferase involved in cell wall biosynthesis
LKVLISHTSIYKKAGWGRIFPLAAGLTKMGNTVTILTTNPYYSIFIKHIVVDGIKIIIYPEIIPSRISKMGFGFLSLFLRILHVFLNRYDIVHSDNGHRPLSGIPCRISKHIFGSTYIAEWYDWYGKGGEYENKKLLFKILLGRYELKYEIKDKDCADGIIVLSETLKQRAQSLFPGKKIIKLHGGADVDSIPFLFNNRNLKEKFGIDKNLLTFGYIDAFSVDFTEVQPLIDSILELRLESKVKILTFGRTRNLELTLPEIVKNMIINFGWINYSEDFEKLMCVDVFVLFKHDTLSNQAGWPNCVGDYLACGRPILINPVGEVVEFAEKHPEGLFICKLNDESISKHINYIMDHRTDLLEKGRINRNVAEREISWFNKSIILNDFYKEVLNIKE